MDRAIKMFALCILVGSVLLSSSILLSERYKIYSKEGTVYLIKLDTLTGKTEVISGYEDLKINVYSTNK